MGQPVVHFEIGCNDKEKTEEFFSKLFDWKIERIAWLADPDGNVIGLGKAEAW